MKQVVCWHILCATSYLLICGAVPIHAAPPVVTVKGHPAASDSPEVTSGNNFRFEIISIRQAPPESGGGGITPDGYRSVLSLERMIKIGYASGNPTPFILAEPTRVVNLPRWESLMFAIDARVSNENVSAWQNQGRDRPLLRKAMRALLEDRFKLVLHAEPVDIPDYELVIRGKTTKLKPASTEGTQPVGVHFPDGGITSGLGRGPGHPSYFYRASMADLVLYLSNGSDRPIFDKTGLTGRYDFVLFRPEDSSDHYRSAFLYDLAPLGLRLQPGTGPGINLVIEHIDRPSPN